MIQESNAAKRKSSLSQVIAGIIAISTLLAAAITIIDSYNTRGIVWQTIQTGEPLLVALILLQTPWFLFGVLFLSGLLKFQRERKLTRNRLMWTGIGTLIASFLVTWGVRASYFGVTGRNYPGQDLLEFRLQTVVAGILFFLFGIIVVLFAIFAEESNEFPPEMLIGTRPMVLEDRIRLNELLRVKHDSLCNSLQGVSKRRGNTHYNIARNQTDCPCSCHN